MEIQFHISNCITQQYSGTTPLKLFLKYIHLAEYIVIVSSVIGTVVIQYTAVSSLFNLVSFRFVSFRFSSFHFISFISFHFISFRFVSFSFVSFHFISFHFLYPGIAVIAASMGGSAWKVHSKILLTTFAIVVVYLVSWSPLLYAWVFLVRDPTKSTFVEIPGHIYKTW